MWTWFLIILAASTLRIDADGSRNQSYQCKPVFLLHGALVDENSMKIIEEWIKEIHPQTVVFNSNASSGEESLAPYWNQINGDLGQQFRAFCIKHPTGIILICHSQGALLCRTLIEVFCDHCVHTFISIAGPQAGYYGQSTFYAPLVPVAQLPLYLSLTSDYFYRPDTQNSSSAANQWNDPTRHSEYLQQNIFLPYINNEVQSNWSSYYKKGFLKLKKLVTIGGPDDGVIVPHQSSEFSFFNADKIVVSYKGSEIYTKDLFGLKTLDNEGRWTRYYRKGIEHAQFILDKEIFNDFIRPHLDCESCLV